MDLLGTAERTHSTTRRSTSIDCFPSLRILTAGIVVARNIEVWRTILGTKSLHKFLDGGAVQLLIVSPGTSMATASMSCQTVPNRIKVQMVHTAKVPIMSARATKSFE